MVECHMAHVQESPCFGELPRALKHNRAITRAVFYTTEDY